MFRRVRPPRPVVFLWLQVCGDVKATSERRPEFRLVALDDGLALDQWPA